MGSKAFELYQSRSRVRGYTKRDTNLNREIRTLKNKIPDSLSYQTVTVYDQEHGYNITDESMSRCAYKQNVAIINSDNLDEKYIYSLPGEDIQHGSLIEWMDNYWLVNERDANTTVYTRAKLIQCNYLLKWVSDEERIIEQWCMVEDGTKYLTGEFEDRHFVVTRGDSRIAITIAKNKETAKFTREQRFLVDDEDSPQKLAYLLTKPLKAGHTYNKQGIYKFVLQEVTSTIDDNQELGIADYYKHFTRDTVLDDDNSTETTGKKVWL